MPLERLQDYTDSITDFHCNGFHSPTAVGMGVQERLFRIHTTPTLSIFNAPPAADQCQWLGLVAWRGHYYQQYCRLVSHSQTPTRQHSNCRSNMESVPETPLYSLYNPVVMWESGCLRLSDTDTDRQQEVHLLYCS